MNKKHYTIRRTLSRHTDTTTEEYSKKWRVGDYLSNRIHERLAFWAKPSSRVCLVCRKAGQLPEKCCNRWTYSLGFILRAPRVNAGRGKWKKFEALLFKIPFNKRARIENLALDMQEQS